MPTTAIMEVKDGEIISSDTNYQGFRYEIGDNRCIPTNMRATRKWETLKSVFPRLVEGRTFIDIGSNFCFFCFKALEYGAKRAIGVEASDKYWLVANSALLQVSLERLSLLQGRFPLTTQHLRGDVVMFLSMIQHVFPKYPLRSIFAYLYSMTTDALIIEWVNPEDRAIVRKGWAWAHPEYGFEQFVVAAQCFNSMELIGKGHHDTREIYLLRK